MTATFEPDSTDRQQRKGSAGTDISDPATVRAGGGWRTVGAIASLAAGTAAAVFMFEAGVIPPLLVFSVLSLIGATLFWFVESRWAGLLPVLTNVVIVGASSRFIIDDWSHPEDVFAFTVNTFIAGGAIVATAAGVAVLARRQDRLAQHLSWAVLGVAVLAIGYSAVVATGKESVAPLAGDVTAETRNIRFVPAEIVLGADDSGIWVENFDSVRHTFSIAGAGLSLDLSSNATGRMDVDLEPGTYQVFCAIEGHQSMKATLVVEG